MIRQAHFLILYLCGPNIGSRNTSFKFRFRLPFSHRYHYRTVIAQGCFYFCWKYKFVKLAFCHIHILGLRHLYNVSGAEPFIVYCDIVKSYFRPAARRQFTHNHNGKSISPVVNGNSRHGIGFFRILL